MIAAAAGATSHGRSARAHQARVLAKVKTFSTIGHGQEELLKKVAGCGFYNVAPWTFATLLNDDKNLADSLARSIRGLSRDAYRVMDAYNVDDKIARLDRAGLLLRGPGRLRFKERVDLSQRGCRIDRRRGSPGLRLHERAQRRDGQALRTTGILGPKDVLTTRWVQPVGRDGASPSVAPARR